MLVLNVLRDYIILDTVKWVVRVPFSERLQNCEKRLLLLS